MFWGADLRIRGVGCIAPFPDARPAPLPAPHTGTCRSPATRLHVLDAATGGVGSGVTPQCAGVCAESSIRGDPSPIRHKQGGNEGSRQATSNKAGVLDAHTRNVFRRTRHRKVGVGSWEHKAKRPVQRAMSPAIHRSGLLIICICIVSWPREAEAPTTPSAAAPKVSGHAARLALAS